MKETSVFRFISKKILSQQKTEEFSTCLLERKKLKKFIHYPHAIALGSCERFYFSLDLIPFFFFFTKYIVIFKIEWTAEELFQLNWSGWFEKKRVEQ